MLSFQDQTALQLLTAIIFPGIISIVIYNIISTRSIHWPSVPLEAAFYGYLNILITSSLTTNFVSLIPYTSIATLIMAILLGVVPFAARRIPKLGKKLPYPSESAWNYAFNKLKKNGFFCIIYLKNGTMVGGYLGSESLIASSCHEGDIYIQWEYFVNDDGSLGKIKKGTSGLVVVRSEISHITFLKNQNRSE